MTKKKKNYSRKQPIICVFVDFILKSFLWAEFWDKYPPEVGDILLYRRGKEKGTRVKDQTADEAQQEDCDKDHRIGRC